MRSESESTFRVHRNEKKSNIDIIRETRKLVYGLGEKERFKIAKDYLNDALHYRAPRLDIHLDNSRRFQVCYKVQTSLFWQKFLLVLSYIYMYAITLNLKTGAHATIGFIVLIILWIDALMEIYHEKFEMLRDHSRFRKGFCVKMIILLLLVMD